MVFIDKMSDSWG